MFFFFFFFNDTATTEIYTLSLHDALPISQTSSIASAAPSVSAVLYRPAARSESPPARDRKSTRLNSSHMSISYAVFCLKKKKNITKSIHPSHNTQRHTSLTAPNQLSITLP